MPTTTVIAIDDFSSVRGVGATWTLVITDGSERDLAAKCKKLGQFRRIHGARLNTVAPTGSSLAQSEPPSNSSACLVAEWMPNGESLGGEIVLFSNLLQLSVWDE